MNCRRNSYRMSATQGALNDCSTPHLGVQANYFLKYMQKKKDMDWVLPNDKSVAIYQQCLINKLNGSRNKNCMMQSTETRNWADTVKKFYLPNWEYL